MKKRTASCRWLASALLLVGASLCAVAQEAGYREFPLKKAASKTESPAKSETGGAASTSTDCPEGEHYTMADGAVVDPDGKGDKLTIEIVDVSSSVLQQDEEFVLTLRVTNTGKRALQIPWSTEHTEPANPDDSSSDIAYVNVDLRTAENRTWLRSDMGLFGNPDDTTTYLLLGPGQWLTLEVHTVIQCKNPKEDWACQPIVSDRHATLTVRWREYLSTHKHEQCSYTNSAYTRRESESGPFAVSVVGRQDLPEGQK
jgi:hypothetical protein